MVSLLIRQVILKLVVFQFLTIAMISCGQSISREATKAVNIKSGEILFESNCASCHKIKVRDGFGNKYFWKNIPFEIEEEKMDWMLSYLKNSDSLVKSGDTYAIALNEEYNNSLATHKFDLSRKEVDQIVTFLKDYFDK